MIQISYGIKRGIILGDPLKHWQPLLEEWLLLIERYCHVEKGDAPYWYSERTTTGLLAAAAWRCGGIALEEYSTEKLYGKDETFKGRADLILRLHDRWDLIEAKQFYPTKPSDTEGVKNKLDEACHEARSIPKNDFHLRIGVLFCCPEIPKAESGLMEKIKTFRSALMSVTCHGLAWCFPAITRDLAPSSGQYKDYRYPGLFLLARLADQ